ncbi:tRNA pseudouridine(55) synthase [Vulcanisaeta thermophila]|uniref:tRNA pseudouridine(55) synthase n=1 Tax=Vulcanisaeta thermophila TaxID=867917 RepID=UPI0008533740|nr:tRNA pseudouridine(54/55) synthase Pus10 [Vulcanisaeta thermophila]
MSTWLTGTLEKSLEILRKYPLCDHCLGRLFARLGFGLSNEERGRAIKDYIHMAIHQHILNEGLTQVDIENLRTLALSGHEPSIKLLKALGVQVDAKPCYVCGGLFRNMDTWVDRIVNALKSLDADYKTFRVGTRVPSEILRRELGITSEFNITTAESIKRELNRELGKRVMEAVGKGFSRERPDVEVLLDISTGDVKVTLEPIYILARYRKTTRTRLDTNAITNGLRELFKADDTELHFGIRDSAGVRVLGEGKPLAIRVVNPRRRPNPEDVVKAVNNQGVSITKPLVIGRSELSRFKSEVRNSAVVYRALALTRDPLNQDAINSLINYFRNRQVNQFIRVGRRVKRRVSMVYEINVRLITPNTLELLIRCQANLNVRGLIHGYWGSVEPSISGFLGTETKPLEIDLIHHEYP